MLEVALPAAQMISANLPFGAEPASPDGLKARLVSETRVIHRRAWRNLTVQVHEEPAHVEPTMVAAVPETQISLQLSGALHLRFDKDGHRFSYQNAPGSVCVVAAHGPDYEVAWQNQTPDPARSLQIYLDNDLLAQTAAACAGLDTARWQLRPGSNLDDPFLRQLGYMLLQEMDQPEAQSDLYADTVAQMLAVHLVRRHGTVRPQERPLRGAALSAQTLRRLGDYVREHLQSPISLDDLAAVAAMSPYHFSRMFKQTTGQTPNEFVIGLRLVRAAHLLRRTRWTVAQVAGEVGYQSVRHFTRLFRRRLGCPPAEYAGRRLG